MVVLYQVEFLLHTKVSSLERKDPSRLREQWTGETPQAKPRILSACLAASEFHGAMGICPNFIRKQSNENIPILEDELWLEPHQLKEQQMKRI
jgi:hypothetical protein